MNGEALAHSLSPLNLLLNCSLILLSTFWANFDSCLPTPAVMSHLSLSLFLLCEPLAPVLCACCNAVALPRQRGGEITPRPGGIPSDTVTLQQSVLHTVAAGNYLLNVWFLTQVKGPRSFVGFAETKVNIAFLRKVQKGFFKTFFVNNLQKCIFEKPGQKEIHLRNICP